MEGFQNFFEKMGSNFMVSAFIPSLAFVLLSLLVFSPIFPPFLSENLNSGDQFFQSSLIVIVISTIIGFILTSLNVFIYKLFEGYIIFNKIPFLRRNKVNEVRRIKKKEKAILNRISIIKKRYDYLDSTIMSGTRSERTNDILRKKMHSLTSRLVQLEGEYEELHYDSDSRFPPEEKYILPTRFGNILRAAEIYSETRYQIDGVTMWTRVIKVIDKDYMGYIDTANNQCSFLLYCSLLSGVFSSLSLIAVIYQLLLKQQQLLGNSHWLYFVPLVNNQIIYDHRIFVYVVFFALALLATWFFYQASLWNVDQYGDVIRSTYDIYRFKLLEELHLEPPESFEEEKFKWRAVSQFYAIGEDLAPMRFKYKSHPGENGTG